MTEDLELIKIKCEACIATGTALVIAPEYVLQLLAEVERLQAIERATKAFIEANGLPKYYALNDLRITMGYAVGL